MPSTIFLLWILVGMLLGVKAEAPAVTLREIEEKINNLGKLEQNVEWLVKKLDNLEQKLIVFQKGLNFLDIIDTFDEEVNNINDSVSNFIQ